MYTYDYPELDMNNANIVGSSTIDFSGAVIWVIIAAILALVGGILVYYLFVKSKNEPKGKFTSWLKKFLAFDVMILEPILKVIYYIGTIFIMLFSFVFIGVNFIAFLVCLILGPILLRIIYETTMMFVMIWKNTSVIAKKK